MTEGVVLFFTQSGRIAHIWCVLSEVPLCLAYRDDFPNLWNKLQVGTRVRLKLRPKGPLMRAVELTLFAPEVENLP